ncbi:4334_t:CDS:2, partial [Scutellospora calospora]
SVTTGFIVTHPIMQLKEKGKTPNGLVLYIIIYKKKLEKNSLHNLREKVIVLNAAKAYRNESDKVRRYYDEFVKKRF